MWLMSQLGLATAIVTLGLSGAAVPVLSVDKTGTTPGGAACQDALTRVQQYRAPGARRTLADVLAVRLASERGPVDDAAWQELDSSEGGCLVALRYTVGGEPVELLWRLDPRTNAVQLERLTGKHAWLGQR